MGYSEFHCQLCGVSFNIFFQLEFAELDIPVEAQPSDKQGQPVVDPAGSIDFTGDDDIEQDPDYFHEDEHEQHDPYQYDSDYESMDTMSDHSESSHDGEDISQDTQSDIEEQWYHEWSSSTFDSRGIDPEEHTGYWDNPTGSYSVDAISPEETSGCRTAQFMVHKSKQSGERQPDELREPWEATGAWARFGICDGTPSREDSPTVWPAQGKPKIIWADNVDWNPQDANPNGIAMPFHPWCFDIFCRQSIIQFKRVNVAGLMAWRNAEIDWECFQSFPRSDDVKRSREQWWRHEPGCEYLVANPLYVPGLPPILLGGVKDADHSSLSNAKQKFELSRPSTIHTTSAAPPPVDLISPLSIEIRLLIIGFLQSEDIARLSMTCKTFADFPNNLWYSLVRKEMPWLWEAWDESECEHEPSLWTMLTTAEIKVTSKARDRYAMVLTRDSYMNRSEAAKAAEYRIPYLSVVPGQIRLSKTETNWHHVFTVIKRNWTNLKGLRNRQRIWVDVEEVVRRIRKFHT